MSSSPQHSDQQIDAPPPVQSFNPVVAGESLSVLLSYEAIIETVIATLSDYSRYAREELGIPFPFNIILVLMLAFVVLYLAKKIRFMLCRPAKKEEPVLNRIDAEDISLVIKGVKSI